MPEPTEQAAATHADTYAVRRRALEQLERTLHRRHLLLGWLRLALALAFVALLFCPQQRWALVPLLAFAVAAFFHGRVLRHLAETRRTLAFYDHALARLEDRWIGLHPRSPRVDTSTSLYASDLDLFGPASLFELLCEARTSLGEDTLAAWLLTPAPLAEITSRQNAIADLRPRLHLREAFAAAPGPALAVLDRSALAAWAERSDTSPPVALAVVAPLLLAAGAAAAWYSWRIHSWLPYLVALLLEIILTASFRRSYPTLFTEAQGAARSLDSAAALLAAIERETFTAERLQALQTTLKGSSNSAAKALRTLSSLATWMDSRANYLVRIFDAPLLYSLQLAVAVRRWKRRHGPPLNSWLNALGEFEALLSLAAYSFEHPQDPFPKLTTPQTPSRASFLAKGLGHPLLPQATFVRNHVTLGGPAQVLLVSGSNMSGKSTLLRSVGVNAVLAFAGAPVRAHSLSLSPLTLGASIQKNDSLQQGRSRFYAEILVLRAIAQAARDQPPVLFLIDEVLAGTNSRDRLTGAQGLVKDLLRHNAIGIFSTHDLALTNLAFSGKQPIQNWHFQDTVENGKLLFDYTLREGVVERSNGIALMRLIGLEV